MFKCSHLVVLLAAVNLDTLIKVLLYYLSEFYSHRCAIYNLIATSNFKVVFLPTVYIFLLHGACVEKDEVLRQAPLKNAMVI